MKRTIVSGTAADDPFEQRLGGSLHLCFPSKETMDRALTLSSAAQWNREHERPLCVTSMGITTREICEFATALPRDARTQTRVRFAPDHELATELQDLSDVNDLEALHEWCREWSPAP